MDGGVAAAWSTISSPGIGLERGLQNGVAIQPYLVLSLVPFALTNIARSMTSLFLVSRRMASCLLSCTVLPTIPIALIASAKARAVGRTVAHVGLSQVVLSLVESWRRWQLPRPSAVQVHARHAGDFGGGIGEWGY